MKKINAYKCDSCKKITQTYSGMYKHEQICFYNPETRSCITCDHLTEELFLGDRILSFQENLLLKTNKDKINYKLWGISPEKLSKGDYGYLNDADVFNYCKCLKTKLHPLRTYCKDHETKQIK